MPVQSDDVETLRKKGVEELRSSVKKLLGKPNPQGLGEEEAIQLGLDETRAHRREQARRKAS